MAGSRKKVIVRTAQNRTLAGYLASAGIVDAESGVMELLNTAGRIVPLALDEVRYVAYVRDFNLNDAENPERLMRKTFLARPKTQGLWVRVTFQDGEVLEGLAALNESLLEDAIEDRGVYLIPPDVRSNTQRMFVPRAALSGMQVLGVITTPTKAAGAVRVRDEEEPTLPFPEPGTKGLSGGKG